MIFHYIFAFFFCQKTSVPSIYVKTVTLDKLKKNNTGSLMVLNLVFCHTNLTLSVY